MRYAIIGVEGPHDQAFVGKVLKLLSFQKFKGLKSDLDPFWHKFIPKYPKKGNENLYQRLDMPSIFFTESLSVAIYAGEGSNLETNLDDILCSYPEYQTNLAAFGIVADCDKSTPDRIVAPYASKFRSCFPNFPVNPGVVDTNSPRTGIYVLPDNQQPGVLDTLLCECGQIAYPAYMEKASSYLNEFSELEIKALKWKNFDRQKALVATVVSVLKPGKTNTTSIADNNWVSQQTQQEVPALANFIKFLMDILELTP